MQARKKKDESVGETVKVDAAIVGAGPVGLFAVFELGMLGLNAAVIDALDVAGGQCAALYPEKPIYDIPGMTAVTGQELIDRLMAQAAPFDPGFHLGRQAVSLARAGERFHLGLSDGTMVDCAAVVIAAGAGAFGPNRPPLDGIEAYEGDPDPAAGVKYLVRRREDFRGKRVVIAGGGDSAVDWAISLSELAASVQVVHRRPKFRAAPDSEAKLRALTEAGAVELVTPFQLSGLSGAGGKLTGVQVSTIDGAQSRDLPADVLLPFFGLSTDLGPIAEWGAEIERGRVVADPTTGETREPGVFAIGDVAAYPHKLKLILTGFSEAAFAAHAIFPRARPGEALRFEHSTSKGAPAA